MADIPLQNNDKITLATFYLDKTLDNIGCPVFHPGKQPEFRDVKTFPNSISQVELEKDIRELLESIEDIFRKTGMPMCPFFLMQFVIPFTPMCASYYMWNERKTKLKEIVDNFNQEKGSTRGIYAEWNEDYFTKYDARPDLVELMFGPRDRSITGELIVREGAPVFDPALKIMMNVSDRQKYCAQNNIEFVTPEAEVVTQPPK